MEFPSRSGGAQGGLIKGNLFAQSGAPAFSNTKHGDSVIHNVNGRISITRDKSELRMPYLLTPYYSPKARLFRSGVEAGTLETDAGIPNKGIATTLGRGVFVGDGYFLCLERREDGNATRPILVSVADSDQPFVESFDPSANVPGANIHLNTEWLMDRESPDGNGGGMFANCIATGWRDTTRRYGFAVFGVLDDGEGSVWASRYVCIVGDTGTRTAKMHFLPTRPDSAVPLLRSPPSVLFGTPAVLEYKTSWWGSEAIYGSPGYFNFEYAGAARCYCVGPGHLLTLLVPQERYTTHARYFSNGGGAATTVGLISPGWLPAGSAPYLLRSRDFGETWSMEKADFLVADEPPTTDSIAQFFSEIGMSPDAPYPPADPGPLQRVGDFSYFIASQLGGGRIAIAALSKYDGDIPEDETRYYRDRPQVSTSGRSWRFYVGNNSGAGFSRKAWPMDSMRANEPGIVFDEDIFDSMPKSRTFEIPVFNPWGHPPRAYSFTPGHFVWASIRYGVDTTEINYDWGTYPQDYPVTIWTTHDYGETWAASPFPSGLMPFAVDLGEYYRAFPKTKLGPGSDMWAARFLTFGSISSEFDGDKPTLTYERVNFTTPIEIYSSEDFDDPIGSLSYASSIFELPEEMYVVQEMTDRHWHSYLVFETFYTGDPASQRYPELVRPGYKEFEEPT